MKKLSTMLLYVLIPTLLIFGLCGCPMAPHEVLEIQAYLRDTYPDSEYYLMDETLGCLYYMVRRSDGRVLYLVVGEDWVSSRLVTFIHKEVFPPAPVPRPVQLQKSVELFPEVQALQSVLSQSEESK